MGLSYRKHQQQKIISFKERDRNGIINYFQFYVQRIFKSSHSDATMKGKFQKNKIKIKNFDKHGRLCALFYIKHFLKYLFIIPRKKFINKSLKIYRKEWPLILCSKSLFLLKYDIQSDSDVLDGYTLFRFGKKHFNNKFVSMMIYMELINNFRNETQNIRTALFYCRKIDSQPFSGRIQ